MMRKKKNIIKKASNKEEKAKNVISEPVVEYKKPTIFHSFEEADEANAKTKANLSPEQHIMNVTKRIKEMYADELKKPMDKNLKFRND